MKKFLEKMYVNAMDLNDKLVIESVNKIGSLNSILDVGCWDGEKTIKYAKACNAKNIYGIEIVEEMSRKAKDKGIKCFSLNVDEDSWPLKNESIDCVVSNQVIEHLTDVDHYFSEAFLVFKKGGFLIT